MAQSEDQQIDIVNTQPGPLTGTFVLNFQGQTTGPIAVGASAVQVETALENLSNISNVRVTAGPNPLGYSVRFLGEMGSKERPANDCGVQHYQWHGGGDRKRRWLCLHARRAV